MATISAPDGTALHVETTGSGPTVMLVHGITESGRSWEPVTERLSGHFQVVVPDLRGHGRSAAVAPYDLATMAGDLAAVITECGLTDVRLVGHSLGGAVVSALAGVMGVHSVINVDQSLRLDEFQAGLQAAAPMLRDENTFGAVISALFDDMAGTALDPAERARIESHRIPTQSVVLGVWHDVIESSPDDLKALVEATASAVTAPYLSLFGIDPGADYADWFTGLVPSATVELWDGFGHYPHLVDPDRFVARAIDFWAS